MIVATTWTTPITKVASPADSLNPAAYNTSKPLPQSFLTGFPNSRTFPGPQTIFQEVFVTQLYLNLEQNSRCYYFSTLGSTWSWWKTIIRSITIGLLSTFQETRDSFQWSATVAPLQHIWQFFCNHQRFPQNWIRTGRLIRTQRSAGLRSWGIRHHFPGHCQTHHNFFKLNDVQH